MKAFFTKYYVHGSFIICFLLLLWRAFLGFCWTDEAFYISTADRFLRGDIPLVDEWFRTQLSSTVMVPFLALYRMIAGYTGVVLYFRILYLVLSFFVALLWYRVLSRKYPSHVALFTALVLMCYAHLNNATFSYYMLSEMFLLAALALIYDHAAARSRGRLVAAGILLALSVLCMPAFALLVVPAVILAVIVLAAGWLHIIPGKNKERTGNLYLAQITGYTLLGIAIPAVIFSVYLLGHMSISYLIDTLPVALVDNEHTNTFGYYIRKPHRCLTGVFGSWTYVSYLLIAVSFIFQKYLKKRPYREIVTAADIVLFAIMAYISYGHTGYIQVCFFLFFIPLFFISSGKDNVLFFSSVITSVAVAVIYCFVSSDFLYVMAIGAAVSTGAGICTVYDLVKGDVTKEGEGSLSPVLSYGLYAVCIVTLAITLFLRMTNVYRDAPVPALTARIDSGVAKGLYTTPEHLNQYSEVYDVIDKHCSDPHKKVLFSKILPWGYIASASGCGYPTTWRTTAYDADQLDIYYKMDTTRAPDVIIVLDTTVGSFDASGDVEDDHEPNLDEMNDYLKDYIRDKGMESFRENCATVYEQVPGSKE